jgi:toxin-antitoxin system PIN domain toxin
MILVDANLLLYAKFEWFPNHDRARQWLDEKLGGPTAVGLPWPVLIAFVRITIHPRAFPQPLSLSDAWKQVEEWLACSPAWTPVPTENHARILGQLIGGNALTPNLIADAHLAALAIEHGLTLCSADGDFARFRSLRWVNPLVTP